MHYFKSILLTLPTGARTIRAVVTLPATAKQVKSVLVVPLSGVTDAATGTVSTVLNGGKDVVDLPAVVHRRGAKKRPKPCDIPLTRREVKIYFSADITAGTPISRYTVNICYEN